MGRAFSSAPPTSARGWCKMRIMPVAAALAVAVVMIGHAVMEEDASLVSSLDAEGETETDWSKEQFKIKVVNATNSSNMTFKKPYENHVAHNKNSFAALGGWTPAQEKAIAHAKEEMRRANVYHEKKEHEKKVAEMGCPCIGEKYYNRVWNPQGPPPPPGPAGNNTNSTKPKCSPTDPDSPCDDDPKFGIKAMLKKYGKLGPESSWQAIHEKMRQEAKRNLKIAEAEAHEAFLVALPEFKKMALEMPEFFTNGKCICPKTWTIPDSVALSEKITKDLEADLMKHKRMLWRQERINSGEEARLAAQELAKEKKIKAKAGKGPAPAPAPAPAAKVWTAAERAERVKMATVKATLAGVRAFRKSLMQDIAIERAAMEKRRLSESDDVTNGVYALDE